MFSQWGEDGIIQYLLGRVAIENPTFVEFGVESYREANTRFLLSNDNWRGLILDAGTAHREYLVSSGLIWRHTIDAVTAFITRENINELIERAGVRGDIGLLSVDVDGNDYWILEAIEVVSPRILIVEYNSLFGPVHEVSVPYSTDFNRLRAHQSSLYFGASLPAFCSLADRKGYSFVGCNTAGNNAFFVRRDVAENLQTVSTADGWVESLFREARTPDRRPSYVSSHQDRLQLIADENLIDVRTGESFRIRDRFL